MRQRVPAGYQQKVDAALAEPGCSLAIYSDGNERVLVTYGIPGADVPSRMPPANWGTLFLAGYCPAQAVEATMRSPLKEWDGGPPQIKAPPCGPSRTVFPGDPFSLGRLEVSGQAQPNPYGHLGPGRAEPEPPAEEPPREGASWWRRQLR
jgi:hypothetical protein